jgi:uncharacterized surface protein with fasciclin (FAS1) repeats
MQHRLVVLLHEIYEKEPGMHIWKRTMTMMMVLAAAALFVAACGDDDDTSSDSKKSDESAMTETEESTDDAMSDDAMSQESSMVGGVEMSPDKNVVENASAAPNLTTVVAAIKAAGLVETLSGPGPFTVFAPDDAAFKKVDPKALASLLEPAQKEALTGILTYHVVPGTLDASKLKDGDELTTVNGAKLIVKIDGDTVMVGNDKSGFATVAQADVFQSNGVAHIIDTVMMPPAA